MGQGGTSSQLQHTSDTVGSGPDHRNKASIKINQVVVFLLVENLAFNL